MIIVISPERNILNETLWVNRLFEAGLDCFHVRKQQLDDIYLAKYLDQIEEKYYANIILHDNSKIATEYGIKRLHYSEKKRKNAILNNREASRLSTSVHSICIFNALDTIWDYAFISPVFPSISKLGYGVGSKVSKQIKLRTNYNTKLIGLGGITPHNMHEVLDSGADGVALLGAIWQSENPVEIFKLCKS